MAAVRPGLGRALPASPLAAALATPTGGASATASSLAPLRRRGLLRPALLGVQQQRRCSRRLAARVAAAAQPQQPLFGSGGGASDPASIPAAAAAAGLAGAAGSSPPPPPSTSMAAVVVETATSAGSSSSGSGGAGADEGDPSPPPPAVPDEPELAVILLACFIGLATGGAIVGFNIGVHWMQDHIWEEPLLSMDRTLLRNIAESDLWPKVVLPPILGGLAVGALGAAIGGYEDRPPPKAGAGSGSGSDGGGGGADAGEEAWKATVGSIVRPVSRAVAAVITLGTGASLGPEGPSVDIGKSWATGLGSSLRSKQRHLTSLIAAGAGAGVAAGFNAPISGVFFAVETVLQKQKAPRPGSAGEQAPQVSAASGLTVAMVLLASVLAAVVSQAGLGSSPAFRVPEYRLESMAELPLYLLLGALCGAVSASFSFSTRVATDAFNELREQNSVEAAITPGIGGLTTGVLALGYPEILYQGFDNVNNILSGAAYAPGLLIQIVVMKVIATSICRGSGLQGGLYAPSIFIGAALGTAFGVVAHTVGDPAGLVLAAPQAYALVGVAAMLASNCAVPLTSVLLLFELTRDYLIILPTMAAVGISFWVSSLAAPSVKNAATARRMSAAAAASAAVSTIQLDPRATEAALERSLQSQGPLSTGGSGSSSSGAASGAAASGASGAASNSSAAAAAPNKQQPAREMSGGWIGGLIGGGDGLDASLSPTALAAAAAAGGRDLLVSAALERSCLLVEAEMPVQRALALMQADGQHIAVVLGDDGGVIGLVTRDVLEECVQAAAEALLQPAGGGSSSSDSDGGGGSSSGGSGGRKGRARGLAVRAEATTSLAGEAEGVPAPPPPVQWPPVSKE